MEVLNLFWVFFRIGMVSFGGGWTIVGIIQDEVLSAGWLDEVAFSRIVGLAQMTPGPVALNTATMVGFQQAGIFGAFLASFSVLLFPMFLLAAFASLARFLSLDRERLSASLRVGTLAMLVMTLAQLSLSPAADLFAFVIALGSFFLNAFTKINPVLLIMGGGFAGLFWHILRFGL